MVVGAILIQLALGALYAWSVFTKLLTDPQGVYRFTATQTAWIFSAGLATFALVMVLAGRWQASTGPRLMSMLGGLLLGLGFVLGGLFGSTFWAQFLFIGVVAGAGIGLAYVVPIAVGVKWFPDQQGHDHRAGGGRLRLRRHHLGQAGRFLVRRPAEHDHRCSACPPCRACS